MRISPFTTQAIRQAVAHITAYSPDAVNPKAFAAYGVAVTAFSAIESTYVPVGQTDTRLRDEARALLAAAPVKPVAEILREAIERDASAVLDRDPAALSWAYLEALAPVDTVADELSPVHARWLRATAYSTLVAYGRPGGGLPPSPAGLTIDVALVPGDKARTRFVDEEDDEGAGLPVTTYTRR